MLGPFFFGVATFTLLFFSGDLLFRVVKLIIEKKMTFVVGMDFLASSLPSILVFTFPMAVLLSAIISFGRLSGESEIIAMKAGGISFYRIASPAIILSLIITMISLFINEKISPEAKYKANNIILKHLAGEEISSRKNMIVRTYSPDGLENIIVARRFYHSQGLMEGVTIQAFKGDSLIRWTFADLARWEENYWYLYNGDIYNLSADSARDIKYKTHFSKFKMNYLKETPREIESREREPEEMNSFQIKKKIKLLVKALEKQTSPEGEKDMADKINILKTSYYQKIAIPFTCFVFALFGIPLALKPHRTSASIGLGLSLIFIFIYYILMSIGRALGENGILPPLAASWMPNIIFASLGIYLLYQTTNK